MHAVPGSVENTMKVSDFRKMPKSDLHNHALLSGKRSVIERFYGKKLARFRQLGGGITGLNQWIRNEFRPFMMLPGAFEKAVEAAFLQAQADGITRLEMSIDVTFGRTFGILPATIVKTLHHYHQAVAPEITFFPELGFPRTLPLHVLMADFEKFPEFDYFRSIDLYDDENARPASAFKDIYRYAQRLGMKCKAHAGEFGSADSVREAIETLELDAVQHGIGAAESPEVMRWIARQGVPLNVCPTSNIRLNRVRSYRTHPIRILFDHGVKVTVNTDDALVFGDGNSKQYFKLMRSGVFSLSELEQIRINGLQ